MVDWLALRRSGEQETMKVAVCVSSGELARYAITYHSLMTVEGVCWQNVMQCRGAEISRNRNALAQQALEQGFDAVWHVDDDQVFAPDTLRRLMAHDKDVVSGLYVQRHHPFMANVFDEDRGDGWHRHLTLKPGDKGLIEVKGTGAGCLLVKRAVFEAMEKPWWRLGQLDPERWGDDVEFFMRVRQAGFKVWCDLDCLVGHQMTGTLWPHRQPNGTWLTALVDGTKGSIAAWPAAAEDVK
jgi:hypothetical protein